MENIVNGSWFRQCADVPKLSCNEEENGLLSDGSSVDSTMNTTNRAVLDAELDDNHAETLNLL